MRRPTAHAGMRHVALCVKDLAACERFYGELLGMQVEWRPDADNVYLTSGADNLALHRVTTEFAPNENQHLDHIGFILREPAQVDDWHEFLKTNGVEIVKAPRTHRDGARSFYCRDPDGNTVQMIYHPPIANAG
ncbi:MAG: VOC family protein [Pseudomonadota bacterium]|nr:MAG: VOC family protein [Pseudomonadota bacterium]